MKIINISNNKFDIGKLVRAIKEFTNGSIKILVGDQGIITDITIQSFPDLSLFDISILHMDFKNYQISMGELVANNYFKICK